MSGNEEQIEVRKSFLSELVGTVFILLGVLTFLALISYEERIYDGEMALPAINIVGAVGHYISHVLLMTFGNSSFLLAPFFAVLGILYIYHGEIQDPLTRIAAALLILIAFSNLIYLLFGIQGVDFWDGGGVIGRRLGRAMEGLFGLYGAIIITLGLFVLGIFLGTRMPFVEFIHRISERLRDSEPVIYKIPRRKKPTPTQAGGIPGANAPTPESSPENPEESSTQNNGIDQVNEGMFEFLKNKSADQTGEHGEDLPPLIAKQQGDDRPWILKQEGQESPEPAEQSAGLTQAPGSETAPRTAAVVEEVVEEVVEKKEAPPALSRRPTGGERGESLLVSQSALQIADKLSLLQERMRERTTEPSPEPYRDPYTEEPSVASLSVADEVESAERTLFSGRFNDDESRFHFKGLSGGPAGSLRKRGPANTNRGLRRSDEGAEPAVRPRENVPLQTPTQRREVSPRRKSGPLLRKLDMAILESDEPTHTPAPAPEQAPAETRAGLPRAQSTLVLPAALPAVRRRRGIGAAVPVHEEASSTAPEILRERESISETEETDEAVDEFDIPGAEVDTSFEERDESGPEAEEIEEVEAEDEGEEIEEDAVAEVFVAPPASPSEPVDIPLATAVPVMERNGGRYRLPGDILKPAIRLGHEDVNREIELTRARLEVVMRDYGIQARVVRTQRGPIITLYEIKLEPGVKVSRILGIHDEIRMNLEAPSVRIIAPIPGKPTVGIEIPNRNRETVTMGDMTANDKNFFSPTRNLSIVLGKDIAGTNMYVDLAKLPHLLIAGATGSGKSVYMNAIIASLLYTRSPQQLRFIMIDPKMVELTLFEGIPHLLMPVIADVRKASRALTWAVMEMERRYGALSRVKCRDIRTYNDRVERGDITGSENPHMPYIVVLIDELSDLMMVAAKDVEDSIIRLTQKARAVGIHVIMATQRPSVDVITALIKANCPARIAFHVAQRTDSRIILDQNGAETLLGGGDMLYSSPSATGTTRIQAPLIEEDEIEKIVKETHRFGKPVYVELPGEGEEGVETGDDSDVDQELFSQAWGVVQESGKTSTSYIQRRLRIGYNRAARLVEMMEERGYLGPAIGNKPREILKKG